MLGRDENRRTFLFTSALPEEGKTFCSTNFSLCLAQQGLRTVIIDGDLRRPAVEQALTKERGKRRGVTDYLTGQARLDEVICSTGHKDFYFIPAGTMAPNPAELLAQGHFEALIDEALTKFDRVVVDSAPIHAVSDTLVMLDRIQTVCLVVRAGKTPRKAVQRSIFLLKQAEAVMGGVILNRMRKRRNVGYNYYYDYSYKGSYSGKGVYGS
jgi:capsular exopolysaccharide synthesis family protein